MDIIKIEESRWTGDSDS